MIDQFNLFLLLVICGVIFGLNSFNVSIFTTLVSSSFGKSHVILRVKLLILCYLVGLLSVFLIIGWAFYNILTQLDLTVSSYIAIVIASLAILMGLFDIKNYYWPPSVKYPRSMAKIFHTRTVKNSSYANAATLAIASGFTLLSNIGFGFLSIVSIIYLANVENPVLNILIFALGVILPLVTLAIIFLRKYRPSAIIKWKEDHKKSVYFAIGMTNIVIGWIVLLTINGSI